MSALKLSHSLYRGTRKKVKQLFSSKYLLYTNTTICVGMSCSADLLQQHFQIHKREMVHMNFKRSRDVAVTGLMIGPFCHYWYILLDKWLPGRTLRIVAKKIIVDQFICSPVVIALFLGTTLYLEGKKGKHLRTEMIDKGKTLYLADWLIWPPAQAFNFFFLPTKFRVLYDNTISFVFDWYYSYVKYGGEHNKENDSLELTNTERQSSEFDIAVTGSHVPSININIMQQQTARGRSKLKHWLHPDNLDAGTVKQTHEVIPAQDSQFLHLHHRSQTKKENEDTRDTMV